MPSSIHLEDLRRPSVDSLFSLLPVNHKAEDVVNDDDNCHLVSSSWKGRIKSFDIGFHINSASSPNTLVTLGRNNCDIRLRPGSIARTQCSFEIDDLNTGIVMFYDRSHRNDTRVLGNCNQPFESGRSPRKVLVYPGVNDQISMGGINCGLIQFRIEWILTEAQTREVARKHRDAGKGLLVNQRLARTFDPTVTAMASTVMSPAEAFQESSKSGIRYFRRDFLGAGSFGRVWRAIDVDSGRVMAMKQIDIVVSAKTKGAHDPFEMARMEVNLMRRAKHPNIADLITSQGWEEGSFAITIFMGLEEGNLNDLFLENKFTLKFGLPERCLHDMLSALDFLDHQGIVHRDVKPENILYSQSTERHGYIFRLSDFGVGKLARNAYSKQGTEWYMAPEILRLSRHSQDDGSIREQQTPKVDVWSLFVTIAFARNVCNYRNRKLNDNQEILEAAREACAERWMMKYRSMAIEDPAERASALDILIQSFDGVGVTDRDIDIGMSEDDDHTLSNPQYLQFRHHTRLPLSPRRSARIQHPSRVVKNTWSPGVRNQWTETVKRL